MPEVRAERYIPAPPEKVYALAKDLEGLKPYLKEVESLKVLSREATAPGASGWRWPWARRSAGWRRRSGTTPA